MKENSKSRNLKKRWLEGYYVGESVRNGVEVWEGLSHQDKSKFWKNEKEKEDKKRCAKMPRLSLAYPTMGLSLSNYETAIPSY